METDYAVPTAFHGRSNSELRKLLPKEIRRHRHFGRNAFWLVVFAIGVPGAFLLFWPLGIVDLIATLYYMRKCFQPISESLDGKLVTAYCPNCGKQLIISAEAANCVYCRHRLMQFRSKLYDVEQ